MPHFTHQEGGPLMDAEAVSPGTSGIIDALTDPDRGEA
jgi:hypothetical protein